MRKIETWAITGGTINYDVSTPSVNTIEFWIKLKSDFNKTMKLFYNGTLSEIMLDARGSIGVRHAVNNYGNPGSIVYGNILLEKDKSNHIAITIGNSGCKIYINGELSLSTTSINSYSRSFKMISFTEKDGVILEFPKFWSRELSKTEILESYEKKRDLISNIDGLIMYDLFADTGSINEVSNIPTTSSNITNHSKQTILYITKSLILHDGKYKKFNATIPSDGGQPLVPLMTSATQDGITISQSSIDGYYGYGAFGNGQWISHSGARETSPEWVMVDFGEGNEKVVTSYEARAYLGDRYITKHKFQGSNNNIDFVDLFETTESMTTTVKKYEFINETAYRYYRIYAYGSAGGNGRASLSKVQFFEKPTPIIYSYWSTVSTTLPTSTKFSEQGMDTISTLLDRIPTELEPIKMTQRNDILTSGEVGKTFSKTIDLKKYFDIRSIRAEVK